MATITLVTVLYKSDEVLTDFFRSLSKQHFTDYHLCLIDNSPNPFTDRLLKELFAAHYIPAFTHIKNQNNIGVAAANNQGVALSLKRDSTYTLFLNNDIVFEDPHLLGSLYTEALQRDEAFIVPKVLYYGSTKIWMAGGKFLYGRALTEHIGDLQEDQDQFNVPQYVAYAPTCFMLIKNTVFKKIGVMDERYFVYYDDTDLVYRAGLAGYKIWYMPKLCIWHKVSMATGGTRSLFSIYYMSRNRLFFVRKHYKGLSFFRTLSLSLYDGLRIGFKFYNTKQWLAFFKGVWHGLIK